MTRYRNALPPLGGDLFLTDGGIATTLISHEGLELPYFMPSTSLRFRKARQRFASTFERTRSLPGGSAVVISRIPRSSAGRLCP